MSDNGIQRLKDSLETGNLEELEDSLWSNTWKNSYLLSKEAENLLVKAGWHISVQMGDCDQQGSIVTKGADKIYIFG